MTARTFLFCLAAATLFSFSFIYAMIYHGPMWPDDIHWAIQAARVPYDGMWMINLYPACISSASWSVPWPLLPGRIFTGLLLPHTETGLRLFGMVKYLACIALIAGWGYVLFEKRFSIIVWLAVSASLLGLGFLPAVMVFNRPETVAFIGTALLYTLVALSWRVSGKKALWLVLAGFLILLSWYFGIHPKMRFSIPLVIALALVMQVPGRAGKVILMVGVVTMAASCLLLWRVYSFCPEAPRTAQRLSHFSVVPEDFNYRPKAALKQMVYDLKTAPRRYFQVTQLSQSYLNRAHIFWKQQGKRELASGNTLKDAKAFTGSALVPVANAANYALLIILAAAGAVALVLSTRKKFSLGPFSFAHVWWLLFPIGAVAATKKTSFSFYEVAYLWPQLLLAGLLLIAGLGWHRKWPKYIAGALMLVMLIGLLSYKAYYSSWHDFYDYAGQKFKNGVIPVTRIVQGIGDSEDRAEAVFKTAAMCDIAPDSSTRHLIVDDTTYMAMNRTFQPYYGPPMLAGPQIMDFLRRNAKTPAIIALCENLPELLRNQSKAYDGICCVKERK